jgi:mannosyl-3-phosphoglycerate phosphatase family protein
MDHGFQVIVITDVEEVLFSPNVRVKQAMAALRCLSGAGTPVILWSSGTRAELEWVRTELGNDHPFFVENGSALYLPCGYFPVVPLVAYDVGEHHVIEFGCSHQRAAGQLQAVARHLDIPVTRFCDRSVSAIAAAYGMSLTRARLATLRQHDEPFQVLDPTPVSRGRLMRGLRRAGLFVTTSDRCDHVNGVADPGTGVSLLRSLYESAAPDGVITVGLGSAANHVPLLREADLPVVVPQGDMRVTKRLLRRVPIAREAIAPGPTGKRKAVSEIVCTLQRMTATTPVKGLVCH